VVHVVLASLMFSHTAGADEPLQASLDHAILAQPYENSVRLNLRSPRTAVDRDPSSPHHGTIYAIAREQFNFSLQRSLDGGRKFDDPIVFDQLCPGRELSCQLGGPGPDIAVGNGGIVYLVVANATEVATILRSVDQGRSWQTAASFDNFGLSVSIETDDETGAVYVAGSSFPSGTVLVTRSLDEGQTWNPPVNVSSSRGGAWAIPHVAASGDDVVVAFLSGTGSPAQVSVAVSHDGGLTWPISNAISPQTLCREASPSVSVSHDGIFAVSWYASIIGTGCYWEGGGGTLATFVSISRDHGDSFSDPIEVSRYPGEADPGFGDALVFDNRSRLHATWHSFEWLPNRTLASFVYVGSSEDLGQNFDNASFRVTFQGGATNMTSSEHLVAGLNDSVYLTWYDFRGSEPGALFRSVSGEASGEVVSGMQPVPGMDVDVELVDPETTAVRAQAIWRGTPLVFAELPPDIYDVWIRVGNESARAGAMPVRIWSSTAFTIRLEGGTSTPSFPWSIAAAAAGVVAFAGTALLALQHTRLVREEILQRKVRRLIYECIQGHPGFSFTEIKNAVGLQNGVAAYHLRVLEKQGLIHAKKGRHHRRYYPNGDVSLWREVPLSPLQKSLVERVRQAPGIGIRELARNLNHHHASVAYNVKGLAREGFLRTQRTGRKIRCYPMDGAT
jgi:DNA-binding MarR family transcriptional regulator